MENYSVTNQGESVFHGTLKSCLRVIAMHLGGIEGASRVTIHQAMASPYRIVRA